MAENGWCPYCQEITVQETTLVRKGNEDAYETTCYKCKHLLRWHLVSVKDKKEKGQ